MQKDRGGTASRTGAAALLVLCAGCGSPSALPPIQPLDPAQSHFGKSSAEWAAAWVEWVYGWPETSDCPDPIADQTGALCTFGQNTQSPVFFLAGNWGGVTRRADCVAPAGRPLLVPLIVSFFDNGGVPAANQKTDAELKGAATAGFPSMNGVGLSIDGQPVAPLDPYAVVAAPYEYTLPAEPNAFTCQGAQGVIGTYAGYATGYFALLPPLPPGPHTIAFTAKDTPANAAPFALDVAYAPLTVR